MAEEVKLMKGNSAPAIYDIPSCFRLTPGLDDEVMTAFPQPAPP